MKILRQLLVGVLACFGSVVVRGQAPEPLQPNVRDGAAPMESVPAAPSAPFVAQPGHEASYDPGVHYAGYEYGGPGYCDPGYGGACPPQRGGWCSNLFGERVFTRTGRGYFTIDAVMLHREQTESIPLVAYVPPGNAAIATDMPNFGMETLPRFTGGYVFANDLAVEGTYFYKDDMNGKVSVVDLQGRLAVPGVTTIPNFTSADLNMGTGIQSVELNIVETNKTFNFLMGVRWLEIQDHLRFRADRSDFVSQFVSTDIDTYNSMLGGQGGVRTGIDFGLFRLETQGKAGLFFNNGISHTQQINPAGTFNRRVSGNCESFVGDLSIMLSYRPSPQLALRAGYQAMWICNTALAAEQLDPLAPSSNAGLALDDHGDLMLHGPSAGLEFKW